ncbi:MAG: hypothetical protein V1799_11215 [bacterium]
MILKKAIVVLLLLYSSAVAQKQYTVMDWKTEYTVNTYLVQRLHEQYDGRRAAFQKAISSRNSALEYIKRCRAKYLQILGELPEKASLHPSLMGSIQKDGYSIEKIVYESFKQHHVTANLYIPKGKGPFPAALLFCGHEDVSKATESYQKMGDPLCEIWLCGIGYRSNFSGRAVSDYRCIG